MAAASALARAGVFATIEHVENVDVENVGAENVDVENAISIGLNSISGNFFFHVMWKTWGKIERLF